MKICIVLLSGGLLAVAAGACASEPTRAVPARAPAKTDLIGCTADNDGSATERLMVAAVDAHVAGKPDATTLLQRAVESARKDCYEVGSFPASDWTPIEGIDRSSNDRLVYLLIDRSTDGRFIALGTQGSIVVT